MLRTPLGYLEIKVDDNKIEYDFLTVASDQTCPNLNGRYAIVVFVKPDKSKHTISCRIKNYIGSINDGPESGQNLELYSFYQGDIKLSIGMEGDTGYLNGKRLSDYDYDTEYLVDGVQYCVLSTTETARYVFGVAWINRVSEKNDTQTWFGADPTLPEFKKVIQ